MHTVSMLEIAPINAFNDNYIWAIVHPENRHAAIVDPGDATPVLDFLRSRQLQLAAILITHHHHDHVGGIEQLITHAEVPVYGPKTEQIPGRTDSLSEGDCVELTTLGCHFDIIDCPGHTAGHIAYFEPKRQWLFCGDTLFAAGCGRLFEGTAQQMHDSLSKFAALAQATQVFCAHEYTLANLQFAKTVEPNNADIQQRIQTTQMMRDNQQPSLPSNIALELKTNPFMRCEQMTVIQVAEKHSHQHLNNAADTLKVIRHWKDNF